MADEQLIKQLETAVKGIEEIKESNKEIKKELIDLKIGLGKLETKIDGIDTRLAKKLLAFSFLSESLMGGTPRTAFARFLAQSL